MRNRLYFRAGIDRGSAFTIIELLVAVTIAIALLLTLLDGWTTGARASAVARQWVVATGLAREQLDYLCSRAFTEAPTTPTPRTISATTAGNVTASTFTFVVHKNLVTGRTDEKIVSVTVSWTEGGLTHHVELESMLYSSGF